MTDMSETFNRLHIASRAAPPPDAAHRRALLDTLRTMVIENKDAFADAISADFGGRARAETELLEVVPLLNAIRHARKSLPRWMRDERRHVAITFQPGKAWIRHEPLGVIGIIAPWNYPLLLALGPLVDVLAAGNRAMLKPSELTPAFSDLLKGLIRRHFEADAVGIVTGGVEVAQTFSALPFDHLVFTGSTAIGRHVMRAAAGNLTPVTLELGGKSPAIVCPDYAIDKAASSIAFGKFLNAGQTCIAPDYALVPADEAEAFAHAIMAAATRAYPTIQANGDYSNIIGERHRARLTDAIEQRAARVRRSSRTTTPAAATVRSARRSF